MTWIHCYKCHFNGSTYLPDNSCPNCGNPSPMNLTKANEEALNHKDSINVKDLSEK